MIKKKKSKFKPLYKKFFLLKENIQHRRKLLKFKKKKWKIIIKKYKQSLKWYRKFKPKNQNQYIISKYPNRGTSYKQKHRDTLNSIRKINYFYGILGKKKIKNQVKDLIKKNQQNNTTTKFIEIIEQRIDVILYRAKFCPSIRNAQQLIIHGNVLVNNKKIRIKSYQLKPGDLISIKPESYKIIENNIRCVEIWPIVPKHLIVNYKTMQIVLGNIKHTNLSTMFLTHLKLEKILNKFI